MSEDYEEFVSLTLRTRMSKKRSRKKLETSMAPAMSCKTSKTCKYGETRDENNEFKSKHTCMEVK